MVRTTLCTVSAGCAWGRRADQPSTIYCGTIPGGLFRSDDRGDSWQLVRSLWDHPLRLEWFGGGTEFPALHSICVNPSDANHIVVGVSCGGVWVSKDCGDTWNVKAMGMWANFLPPEQAEKENGQDPHCVVRCAAQPDHFWTQHHCGIWRSTDDCETWDRIESAGPSVFGSTTGSVFVTENQGDSWQCVSTNLPQVYVVRFRTCRIRRPRSAATPGGG